MALAHTGDGPSARMRRADFFFVHGCPQVSSARKTGVSVDRLLVMAIVVRARGAAGG
jgi:hypothetical protein